MFIRSIIFVVLLLGYIAPCQAASLMKLPMEAQLKELCVPLILASDREVHYFYYRHIKEFSDRGVSIVFGRHLMKVNFISRDKILNFEEAKKRYHEIRSKYD